MIGSPVDHRDMHFKQFYLGCLAHASYLIGSNGEAAVIDPQRDVQQYIDEAEAHGMRIRYVLETHLHADFVSAHVQHQRALLHSFVRLGRRQRRHGDLREHACPAPIDLGVHRKVAGRLGEVAGHETDELLPWNAAGLELETTPQISVAELHARLEEGGTPLQVVDVRAEREYATGRVPGAKNVPLPELEARLATDLDPSRPTAVVCAGGYRSAAAASLLQRHGFKQLYNIIGGTSAWESAGYQTER